MRGKKVKSIRKILAKQLKRLPTKGEFRCWKKMYKDI